VALSTTHPVRLVSTTGVEDIAHERFEIHYAPGDELVRQTEWADVIVFQGFLMEVAWWLVDSDKIIVADVYDPMHLEQLEQAKDLGEDGRRAAINNVTAVLNRQLARADYMLCASTKQRDLWIGQLAALGRVNALTVGPDRSFSTLVGVVPSVCRTSHPYSAGTGFEVSSPASAWTTRSSSGEVGSTTGSIR